MGHITGKLYRAALGRVSNVTLAVRGTNGFVLYGRGKDVTPGHAAYAAMKGGIDVLTRYMAKELGPRRIAVNALAPGAIETDFGGGAVRDNPEINQTIAAQTALGRVGLPDDIGGAVASLLSEDNRWINGQRVEVSGGIFL